jgi:hypothetical protein
MFNLFIRSFSEAYKRFLNFLGKEMQVEERRGLEIPWVMRRTIRA